MMKVFFFGICALLVCTYASANTVVSFNLKDISTAPINTTARVNFTIRNCGGSVARVVGAGVVSLSKDYFPDSSGHIGGIIYSNAEINCGGQANTWYTVTYYLNGMSIYSNDYRITSNATWDWSNATPMTKIPADTPPDAPISGPIGTNRITDRGASTAGVLNNIRIVDGVNFTSIQAAISDLVAANPLGGRVYDARQGSLVEPACTIAPGVSVYLAAANYGFLGPITMAPGGCHLIGAGSGNNGGSLIHFQNPNIGELIVSANTSGGVYWDDCTIESLRLNLDQGPSVGNTNGIHIWNFGQSASIRDVEVHNAPAAGILINGNPVPIRLDNVSLFSNGTYGLDMDFNIGGNTADLTTVTGDNNGSGLFRFSNGSDRTVINIYGTKSERTTSAAVNNPVITLNNLGAGTLSVFGAHFFTLEALAGTPSGDIVRITGTGTPTINIYGASQRSYSLLVNDVANGRVFGTQGTLIDRFEYAPSFLTFRNTGASTEDVLTSGSQIVHGYRQWNDAFPRIGILGTGALRFGPGNTATDAGLARGTVGAVTCDAASPGDGGCVFVANHFVVTGQTGVPPIFIQGTNTTPVLGLTVNNHPLVFNCGNTSACTMTQLGAVKIAFGSVQLIAGTVTVTGLNFTSGASYGCTGTDHTSIGAVGVSTLTASTAVLNGSAGDRIFFICIGT